MRPAMCDSTLARAKFLAIASISSFFLFTLRLSNVSDLVWGHRFRVHFCHAKRTNRIILCDSSSSHPKRQWQLGIEDSNDERESEKNGASHYSFDTWKKQKKGGKTQARIQNDEVMATSLFSNDFLHIIRATDQDICIPTEFTDAKAASFRRTSGSDLLNRNSDFPLGNCIHPHQFRS